MLLEVEEVEAEAEAEEAAALDEEVRLREEATAAVEGPTTTETRGVVSRAIGAQAVEAMASSATQLVSGSGAEKALIAEAQQAVRDSNSLADKVAEMLQTKVQQWGLAVSIKGAALSRDRGPASVVHDPDPDVPEFEHG